MSKKLDSKIIHLKLQTIVQPKLFPKYSTIHFLYLHVLYTKTLAAVENESTSKRTAKLWHEFRNNKSYV